MNYLYIYNYKIVKDLLQNNFSIKDIKSNPENKDRTVFMFEDTEKLRDYLTHAYNLVFPR